MTTRERLRIRVELSQAEAIGVRPVGRRTVAEFEGEFLAFLRGKHKDTTYKHDLISWNGLFLPAWGDAVLSEVTRGDVQSWLTKRATGRAPGRRRAVGRATINRDLAFLSVMFRHAVDLGLARDNPCAGIRRGKEDELEYPYLSDEDIARIVQHLDSEYSPLVEVLAGTGLRLGEGEALRWSDVYLMPVDGCDGELVVRASKSSKSRRVPLRARVAAMLEGLNLQRETGAEPTALVFPGMDPSRRRTLNRRFHRACETAGLPKVRIHDLRHHFGSSLARRGVPIPDIAKLMGHETISVTMRYAKHAPRDASSRAIQMLDARPEHARPAPAGRRLSDGARGTNWGTIANLESRDAL